MIDEDKFNEVWERAEAETYASRMKTEYPHWRTRRRRTVGVAALAIATTGIALQILPTKTQPMTAGGKHSVTICNRTDMASQYWVDMADALLMEA